MDEKLKECPFCGKGHRITRMRGIPMVRVTCIHYTPERVYIPVEYWQKRPIEDAIKNQKGG